MKNNGDIQIREATVEDAAAVSRLNISELGYGLRAQETAERISQVLPLEHEKLLVAELDGKVVGYIDGCTYECVYTKKMIDILALAVRGDTRRQGVGEALMRGIEDWGRSKGAAGVRLISRSDRKGAHQFYEAIGYHKSDEYVSFKSYYEGEHS